MSTFIHIKKVKINLTLIRFVDFIPYICSMHETTTHWKNLLKIVPVKLFKYELMWKNVDIFKCAIKTQS